MAISHSAIIQRVSSHPFQKLDNEILVVTVKQRTLHVMNNVGSRIWELTKEPTTYQKIINNLLDEYEIDRKTAELEVADFLNDLNNKKLIEIK